MNPFWTLLRYRVMTGGEMFTVTGQSSRVYSPSQTTAPPATQTNLRQFFNSDKLGWYFCKNHFPLFSSVCYLLWSVSERFGESTAGWKALYTAVLLSFSILQPLQWLRWSKCENTILCLFVVGSVRSSLCYQLRHTPLLVPSTTVYFYTQPNARV